MKCLLIFVDWYLPGYKAGGQISSCSNIVNALKNELAISIITRDRDLDSTTAYPDIIANTWQQRDGIRINYLSPGNSNAASLKKLIVETAPDTIYFNSMFSYKFTLLPLLVIKRMRFTNKIIIAPRGMLQAGALKFKLLKKKSALAMLYHTGLIKNVLFHATDEMEVRDIKKNIKGKPALQLAYDFPAMKQESFVPITKQPGYLKCLFVSRVVKKKNLLYLLNVLLLTKKNIDLTIVGPIEDKKYWEDCLQQIKNLPVSCRVQYTGSIPNNQLAAVYRQHHLFVLPTLGENFGHVIFDSFLNGRPALISKQTPWQQLAEKKAGFDLNLADIQAFLEKLEYFADMDNDDIRDWSNHAWLFAQQHILQASGLKERYKLLFS